MARRKRGLGGLRVLISNDDGVNSPGIKRLEKVARTLSEDVWVVAPEREQSASSHSLTLRTPLRFRKLSARRFAVDGTPTDCILLAVNKILDDKRPGLVLSGFNRGSNLGEDTTYSGTIAAAMEATLLGIPGIALSQAVIEETGYGGGRANWTTAESYAGEVITKLMSFDWPAGVLMNVNFPAVPPDKVHGIEITREGRRKIGDEIREARDPRGDPYYWIGAQQQSVETKPGTDLDAIRRGAVSVTPLSLDHTHRATMRALAKVLD
jgi:5'-nucleotidase